MSFGVYSEGDTLAHRLDPRAKLLFALLYIVASFLVQSPWGFAAIALAAVLVLAASGTGARGALRALKPFWWLIVFVFVFDVLFVDSGEVFFQAGVLCVSSGGVAFAVKSVVRFCCVLLGTSALMTTTSSTELSDGAALLLEPLERLGLKTHGASVALGMTLRFIPVITQEFQRVREAQELRCADFSGGAVSRLRAYVPVIIPLFQGAFRRAETLALAMENREYDASLARSSIRSYSLSSADAGVIAFGAALLVFAVVDLVLL